MPRVKRSQELPALTDYRDYKPFLRLDFQFRCAYCHIPELIYGGGSDRNFVVEHFRPKSRPEFEHLTCDYSNLYYACNRCNDFKGAKWPSVAEYETGSRFLDPCMDDFCDHIAVGLDGSAEALTNPATYSVKQLNLNRKHLQVWRAGKAILVADIEALRTVIEDLERDQHNLLNDGFLSQRRRTALVKKAEDQIRVLRQILGRKEQRLAAEFGDCWMAAR